MSSEPKKKKLSLNVMPDSDRVSRIVDRAEANAQSASSSGAGNGSSAASEPAALPLMPPADWPVERKLLHGKIVEQLKTIYDPEIPIDIYELGLIYDVDINDQNAVRIRMTLTAPGCPVAGQLLAAVESKVENIPEVTDAAIDLVWDPPWGPARMSEAARLHLGL